MKRVKKLTKATNQVKKVKAEKNKNQTKYRNIEIDSNEELYALQYLFELKDAGYIADIQRAKSFMLSPPVSKGYLINKKNTSSANSETILQPHSYTPEFYVEWDESAFDIFFIPIDSDVKVNKRFIAHKAHNRIYSYVEVKPAFDFNNMERAFKLNQKWMYAAHNIFVNLMKVDNLFPATFTPKAFLKTPTGKNRNLKWQPKTLEDYVNDIKNKSGVS